MYVCMYVCTYVRTYVCMYACMYVYIIFVYINYRHNLGITAMTYSQFHIHTHILQHALSNHIASPLVTSHHITSHHHACLIMCCDIVVYYVYSMLSHIMLCYIITEPVGAAAPARGAASRPRRPEI